LGFCNPFWLPTSPSTLTHAVSTNLNITTNFKFLMNFRFYLLCSNSNHFLPLLACLLACDSLSLSPKFRTFFGFVFSFFGGSFWVGS
jgi:hypothetical protein